MGRETVAVCHWRGDVAEVRLHLDGKLLSLRGDIKADLDRSGLTDISLCNGGLSMLSAHEPLMIELGLADAERWRKALLKTPPTLAQKLGVSPETPAFMLGSVDDVELETALNGATIDEVSDATQIIALIINDADLDAATTLALANPALFLWAVYPKGKGVVVGDTVIRKHLRGLGLIDSKSCAVSERLTATRYRVRTA